MYLSNAYCTLQARAVEKGKGSKPKGDAGEVARPDSETMEIVYTETSGTGPSVQIAASRATSEPPAPPASSKQVHSQTGPLDLSPGSKATSPRGKLGKLEQAIDRLKTGAKPAPKVKIKQEPVSPRAKEKPQESTSPEDIGKPPTPPPCVSPGLSSSPPSSVPPPSSGKASGPAPQSSESERKVVVSIETQTQTEMSPVEDERTESENEQERTEKEKSVKSSQSRAELVTSAELRKMLEGHSSLLAGMGVSQKDPGDGSKAETAIDNKPDSDSDTDVEQDKDAECFVDKVEASVTDKPKASTEKISASPKSVKVKESESKQTDSVEKRTDSDGSRKLLKAKMSEEREVSKPDSQTESKKTSVGNEHEKDADKVETENEKLRADEGKGSEGDEKEESDYEVIDDDEDTEIEGEGEEEGEGENEKEGEKESEPTQSALTAPAATGEVVHEEEEEDIVEYVEEEEEPEDVESPSAAGEQAVVEEEEEGEEEEYEEYYEEVEEGVPLGEDEEVVYEEEVEEIEEVEEPPEIIDIEEDDIELISDSRDSVLRPDGTLVGPIQQRPQRGGMMPMYGRGQMRGQYMPTRGRGMPPVGRGFMMQQSPRGMAPQQRGMGPQRGVMPQRGRAMALRGRMAQPGMFSPQRDRGGPIRNMVPPLPRSAPASPGRALVPTSQSRAIVPMSPVRAVVPSRAVTPVRRGRGALVQPYSQRGRMPFQSPSQGFPQRGMVRSPMRGRGVPRQVRPAQPRMDRSFPQAGGMDSTYRTFLAPVATRGRGSPRRMPAAVPPRPSPRPTLPLDMTFGDLPPLSASDIAQGIGLPEPMVDGPPDVNVPMDVGGDMATQMDLDAILGPLPDESLPPPAPIQESPGTSATSGAPVVTLPPRITSPQAGPSSRQRSTSTDSSDPPLDLPDRLNCIDPDCKRTFPNTEELDTHLEKDHGVSLEDPLVSKENPADAALAENLEVDMRPFYQCAFCQKVFRTKSGLKNHMSIHTGFYRFWCDTCKKGFNNSAEYKRDQNRHAGNGVICLKCNKVFLEQKQLDKHRKTCTENKNDG